MRIDRARVLPDGTQTFDKYYKTGGVYLPYDDIPASAEYKDIPIVGLFETRPTAVFVVDTVEFENFVIHMVDCVVANSHIRAYARYNFAKGFLELAATSRELMLKVM